MSILRIRFDVNEFPFPERDVALCCGLVVDSKISHSQVIIILTFCPYIFVEDQFIDPVIVTPMVTKYKPLVLSANPDYAQNNFINVVPC